MQYVLLVLNIDNLFSFFRNLIVHSHQLRFRDFKQSNNNYTYVKCKYFKCDVKIKRKKNNSNNKNNFVIQFFNVTQDL